jgi:signal transduction histidine kinase
MAAALEDAVTKLKMQERAMTARAEESERLSDQIMVSLNSGLLVVGLDERVRVVNPAAARLLELPERSGVPYREVLRSAPPLADLIARCLATGDALTRQTLRLDHPQKGTLYFGVGISPLRDGQGSLQGAICLFTDLTAVAALEEQVRLKESLARLGELTAGLAHEFRNGLATVHGYGRLIDPSRVPEQYRPYVTGIQDETASLGRIVENFLTFARPVPLARAAVPLSDVAASAVEDVRDDAVARGGSILISGRFATVEGDATLLRQAFSNLLRNALEACGEAGTTPAIRLDGEVDEAREVARVRVADNGGGVPRAIRDRLFTPFFTTKAAGTGLGLALVQKIVVSHDGRVTVADREGGGAVFEVELPLAPAAAAPQP